MDIILIDILNFVNQFYFINTHKKFFRLVISDVSPKVNNINDFRGMIFADFIISKIRRIK